jgi:hypothetical protein
VKHESPAAKEAFEHWYANGRSSRKTAEHVKVSDRHVQRWMADWDWHARADARDQEAFKQAEREAINRRAKTLEEHRRAGELMRRRGEERLRKHEIETSGDAIRAIKEGVILERQAEHLPTVILELMGLPDEDLYAERERLLRNLQAAGDPAPDRGTGEAALASAGDEDGGGDSAARPALLVRGRGEPEAGDLPEPDV